MFLRAARFATSRNIPSNPTKTKFSANITKFCGFSLSETSPISHLSSSQKFVDYHYPSLLSLRKFSSQASLDDKKLMNENNLEDGTSDDEMDPLKPPGWELIHSPPKDRINTPRGSLVGEVVSDKMDKTVNVAVDRFRIVPKYRKRMRFTRKFMAHDEEEVCTMGDLVMIAPDRKRSKNKHFRVHKIIRAKGQL